MSGNPDETVTDDDIPAHAQVPEGGIPNNADTKETTVDGAKKTLRKTDEQRAPGATMEVYKG